MRLLLYFFIAAVSAGAQTTVVDFESASAILPPADKANRVEKWEDKGVVFQLAHTPKKTQAKGFVMFFEHLSSGHKGIGSAMALEEVPVRATFPKPVSEVSVSFWGSTVTPAVLEAFDADGKVVDRATLAAAPAKKAPSDPAPTFTLSVKGAGRIAYIQFSGPRPGEFLAADEVRFTP